MSSDSEAEGPHSDAEKPDLMRDILRDIARRPEVTREALRSLAYDAFVRADLPITEAEQERVTKAISICVRRSEREFARAVLRAVDGELDHPLLHNVMKDALVFAARKSLLARSLLLSKETEHSHPPSFT